MTSRSQATSLLSLTGRHGPDELAGWFKSEHLREFEELTRALGVSVADYGHFEYLAEWSYRGLKECAGRRLPLPHAVIVNPYISEVARMDVRARTLHLNPQSTHLKDRRSIRERIKREHGRGLCATKHEFHVLRHEIGHLHHADATSPAYVEGLKLAVWPEADGPGARQAASMVSDRALASATEFVTEVYAALLDGQVVSPEVLDWYHHYRGPRPDAAGHQASPELE